MDRDALIEYFISVRKRTQFIVSTLETDDYIVQTADFMSPPRWHLGHTSWFFEMLLQEFRPNYKTYSSEFLFYFNSYYERFGSRIARPNRGRRSRPTLEATLHYRKSIDDQIVTLLQELDNHPRQDELQQMTELGLHHEMQHQELLLMDIKHLLGHLYRRPEPCLTHVALSDSPAQMITFDGGLREVGHSDRETFAYDNEKPRHKVYIYPFAMDNFAVSNQQYLEFINDGGYRNASLWLDDGWRVAQKENWQAPLYWHQEDNEWLVSELDGLHEVKKVPDRAVTHVSYFEAAAFARWCKKRLPTEFEWEWAAVNLSKDTDATSHEAHNLFDSMRWHAMPVNAYGTSPDNCFQLIGNTWEWTSSDYAPYPGFRSEFSEYNDKWMINQRVLRGGSFATPNEHIRHTYRNFYFPHDRWVFSGFRCAKWL